MNLEEKLVAANQPMLQFLPNLRVWHKIYKEMYYFVEYTSNADGSISISAGNSYQNHRSFDFDDIELMLCTDFKDCRGINIWQGDILENYHHDELAVVQFGKHKLYIDGVYAHCTGFHTNHDSYEHYDGLSSETIRDNTRVIGSVHENSELLASTR